LSGKLGKQSLRFRAAKTFFFGITIFLYQNKNPVAHLSHCRQFCASLNFHRQSGNKSPPFHTLCGYFTFQYEQHNVQFLNKKLNIFFLKLKLILNGKKIETYTVLLCKLLNLHRLAV
jgi:hypothetical protein